jgi:hypothetical protein
VNLRTADVRVNGNPQDGITPVMEGGWRKRKTSPNGEVLRRKKVEGSAL